MNEKQKYTRKRAKYVLLFMQSKQNFIIVIHLGTDICTNGTATEQVIKLRKSIYIYIGL